MRRPDRVLHFAWTPALGGAVEPPVVLGVDARTTIRGTGGRQSSAKGGR